MSASTILPQAGMKIKLNNKTYLVKYTVKSMAILSLNHGTPCKALDVVSSIYNDEVSVKSLAYLADLFHAGLLDYKVMTAEYIARSFQVEELYENIPVLIKAYAESLGDLNKKKEKLLDPSWELVQQEPKDWPWERLFTWAITFLRLPEERFWNMAPKCLFAMITEWQDQKDYEARLYKFAMDGNEFEPREKSYVTSDEPDGAGYVHPDCF